VTYGGSILINFPDNQLSKFHAIIALSRIFIHPLNFYELSCNVPLIGWTPLTDTTDTRTERQTNKMTCLFVRLSLRWSLTHCQMHSEVAHPL